MEKIKRGLPDKYCPACGSVWIPWRVVGPIPTCQCSCVLTGTIRFDPVSKSRLTVEPYISTMAQKYLDGEYDAKD